MRHDIYSTLLAGASLLALAGCETESDFRFPSDEGQLNCNALSVDYINSGTRSNAVDVDNFTVNIVNTRSGSIEKSYAYGEMPEIVTLPVGSYRAEAYYGNNELAAEWDNPYYKGSAAFDINAGELTDRVDPIECVLSNIKVEVDVLDDTGMDIVGDDINVNVVTGQSASLTFDSETINKTSGYFKAVGATTLVAEFAGTVDGTMTKASRAYDDVAPGKSYRIIFRVNRPDNTNPGGIGGDGIDLDTKIQIIDETKPVDPGSEPDIYEDDMRPTEGEDPGTNPDDPTPPGPDDPTPPAPSGKGPEIIAHGFTLGQPYKIMVDEDDMPTTPVIFTVKSQTGITEFKINIDSDMLDADTLEDVELSPDLDLINPGEFEGKLNNLGFDTGDNVKGATEKTFDITQFVPLLMMLGPGNHKFNLTVTDSNGTTRGTVYLVND